MKVMALIPARGGSKGIPGKNIRPFAGSSLLARAVDVGREVSNIVLVSTDSLAIGNAALVAGAGYILRPDELATDEAPMLGVVQHALAHSLVGAVVDVVVLLQPTQPLRTADHVYAALMLLQETGADSVVSVVEIPAHYSPDYACALAGDRLTSWEQQVEPPLRSFRLLDAAKRRQDARPAFSRDGTVYAIRRETIEAGSLYGADCRAIVIPAHESVNIDTEDDWRRAEAMVNHG